MLLISSWPMLISIDVQARCSCFSSREPWLTLLCCREHKVPENSVSFSVPLLLKVSEGRKKNKTEGVKWRKPSNCKIRFFQYKATNLGWPGWVFTSVPPIPDFCGGSILQSCLGQDGSRTSPLQCTPILHLQPSSTNKHHWGICVCYIWV